jgi:hypothetical protein
MTTVASDDVPTPDASPPPATTPSHRVSRTACRPSGRAATVLAARHADVEDSCNAAAASRSRPQPPWWLRRTHAGTRRRLIAYPPRIVDHRVRTR